MVFLATVLVWIAWLLQLPPRSSMWLVFASGLPLVALGSRFAAARAGEAWRSFVAHTADFHVLWLVLLFAVGVQIEDAHGVTTDGVIYFTQLRSVIFDGDLDVAREFAFLQQPPRPAHIVPIGPIPIWVPLYLAVAATDAVGRAIGWWPAPPDPIAIGLTTPYIRAVLLSSFAVGAAGLVAVHALLRREFERSASLAATLLLLGGTSLFWYLVYEPSMTHAASFGFVAFFVAAVARCDPRFASPKQLAAVGTLLGLAFVTRPQEAVFALFPAIYVFALRESWPERVKIGARYAGWALAGFLPFLLLQLAHSYVLFSREQLVLIGGEEGFLDLSSSRWSETLWSSWHGFLSWTPVAYVALIGTIAYARRQWPWAVAAASIVFAMAWINGATPDLGAGWSFGGRRFVSCLVLLAPGLALLAHTLLTRPLLSIATLATIAIAWNVMLMTQYRNGTIPHTATVSFMEIIRGQAELYTTPPFFYPFAFPANIVFAWRTGLPVDRYDLLGPEAWRTEVDLRFDRNVGRFFLQGWGEPAGDRSAAAWWTAGSPAALVLPLALDRDRPVRIEVEARARLVEPQRRPRIVVRVNDHDIGAFEADPEEPSRAAFSTSRAVWIDGFNRVAFVSDLPFLPVAVHRIAIRSESP